MNSARGKHTKRNLLVLAVVSFSAATGLGQGYIILYNQGGTVTSWAMAQTAGAALGESPLFNSPPLGAHVGVPDPTIVGLVSFNIHQVPEPSVWVLLALGGANALAFRGAVMKKRGARL